MTYIHIQGTFFFLTDDRQTNRNNSTPFHQNAWLTGEPKSFWHYTLICHVLYVLFHAWFVFREYHLFTVHRQSNRNTSSPFHPKGWLELCQNGLTEDRQTDRNISTPFHPKGGLLTLQIHLLIFFLWQSLFWFHS